MIILSNTTAQTIEPGQSITFNTVVMHTGNGECHRPGTSRVKLRNTGIYKLSFSGNVSTAAVGNVAQLNIALGGEVLPETTMKSTAATGGANAFNNVATTTAYKNCCGDYDQVTVVNTGTVALTLDANPVLSIKRVS